jgi:hypothetical protein
LAWGTPSTVGQVWNLLLHSGGNANASSRWGPTAWPCVARRSCCDGGSSRRSEPYTTACRNTIRPSRLCIWTPATTIRRVGRSWVTAGWSARSPSWGAGSGLGRSPVGDRAHPRLSEPVRQAALVHERGRTVVEFWLAWPARSLSVVDCPAAPGPTPLGRPRSPPPMTTNLLAQAVSGSGPDVQVVSKPVGTISTRRMNRGFHGDLWPSVLLAGYARFL